ncbi:MAG TPA: hypothetical protein DDW21_02130, partial [Verrucomicrobiales bacterium]|nr:hypothetical protein [Verrucomicrobiales bacterium]
FIGEGPFAEKPKKGTGFLGVGTEDSGDGEIRVTKIGRESVAETAGLKVGDFIVAIDGKKLKDKEVMQKCLKDKAADEKITILLMREGKEKEITLRLGAR